MGAPVALAFCLVGILFLAPYALVVHVCAPSEADRRRFPRLRLSAAFPGLRTGDLVFFRTAGDMSTTKLTKIPYSHCAVVLREGDLAYLSEAQSGAGLMPGPGGEVFLPRGAALDPLLPRLRHYRGAAFLARLAAPLPPAAEEALKAAAENAQREAFPYPGFRALLAGAAGLGQGKSRHCFQHVAFLLEAAGLAPPGALSALGPVAVCRAVARLPDAPGSPYEPLAELVYDF